jgi:hypothetical protein
MPGQIGAPHELWPTARDAQAGYLNCVFPEAGKYQRSLVRRARAIRASTVGNMRMTTASFPAALKRWVGGNTLILNERIPKHDDPHHPFFGASAIACGPRQHGNRGHNDCGVKAERCDGRSQLWFHRVPRYGRKRFACAVGAQKAGTKRSSAQLRVRCVSPADQLVFANLYVPFLWPTT